MKTLTVFVPLLLVSSAAAQNERFAPFSFAVLSDLHLSERQGVERLQRAMEMVRDRKQIAFVIVLGDIVWNQPPDKLKEMLKVAGVPVHLVYGNNDWKWINDGSYEKAFGARDRTFTFSNCTFILMYDCLPKGHFPEDHKGDLNDKQWIGLEEQFKTAQENNATHTFVAMHIPPSTPGAYDPFFFMYSKTEERFLALLKQYHVTAGLFGHLHQRAEFERDGIKLYVTPSNCWNFISRSQKVDSSFMRIMHVERDKISDELLPVHLEGETFTWDTLKNFYNPKDPPQ